MLFIATGNPHKTDEIRQILGNIDRISDLSSQPLLPKIEETGTTFLENATLKAIGISQYLDDLVLSDDSGLEVDALNKAPGVYSARYAGSNASSEDNNAKLLHELSQTSSSDRTARFQCIMVLAHKGRTLAHFTGTVEGSIISQNRGTKGFGYDPLFIPEGYSQTFAELGDEIKNTLSHRAKALEQVKNWLEKHHPEIVNP